MQKYWNDILFKNCLPLPVLYGYNEGLKGRFLGLKGCRFDSGQGHIRQL